jgi:spermidine synthase
LIQRELLGTAKAPGGEELRLYRHDRDHMIVVGHNELMSTRKWGSEEALATLAVDRIGQVRQPHLLIGGYGMGFTLRAALRALPADARVTVVELVPEILEWARGPMAELTAGCLDDPRVTLIQSDVSWTISAADGDYDAILLDVDNGPDGLVHEDNAMLYSATGLRAARRALRQGGVLAVWSAGPDPVFTRRLEKCRFQVETVQVAARSNGKGAKHVIWLAQSG